MKVELHLSPELHSLVKGFAGYQRQRVQDYIVSALLSQVQGDTEAAHHRDVPEAQARAARRRRV